MAPVFELLFGEGEGVGLTVEEDSPERDGVAPLPDAETAAPEGPSVAPGASSGESKKQDEGETLIVRER